MAPSLHHLERRLAAAALLALPIAAGAQTRAGAAGAPASRAAAAAVVPGVEVLISDSLHLLRGKRVGLITNHTGRDRRGTSTIDLLHRAPGVKLVALYAAEHGIRGVARAGEKIVSTVDSATGIPVHSLYGETRVPTAEMLKDVDVLVYDIQDVGARVYTYQWTMALAADTSNKPFVVLDRPNPIRADRVDGGVSEAAHSSFVGLYPVAMRYGLTPGELLRYLAGRGRISANVHVVPMRNYRRAMWWEDTGLAWANPSPNLRDMDATIVYTGTVYFEGTNVSEGRGTDQPFRLIGAPWLTDAGAIARSLNARRIPGVRFDSTSRTIEAGYKFGGQTIPMVHVTVTDRDAVNPATVGLHLLRAIYARHPKDFTWRTEAIDRLAGSTRLRAAVEREGGVEALLRTMADESKRFQAETRRYWLYR